MTLLVEFLNHGDFPVKFTDAKLIIITTTIPDSQALPTSRPTSVLSSSAPSPSYQLIIETNQSLWISPSGDKSRPVVSFVGTSGGLTIRMAVPDFVKPQSDHQIRMDITLPPPELPESVTLSFGFVGQDERETSEQETEARTIRVKGRRAQMMAHVWAEDEGNGTAFPLSKLQWSTMLKGTDQEFLLNEIRRLAVERIQTERNLNDIAFLREQLKSIQSDRALGARLDWIRSGKFGGSGNRIDTRKGGQLLLEGSPPPGPEFPKINKNSSGTQLDVEVLRDGSVRIKSKDSLPEQTAPLPIRPEQK